MAAPVVTALSYEVVQGADGFWHTNALRWSGVSPFSVSVDAGQFRVSDTAGVFGAWRSTALAVFGTVLTGFDVADIESVPAGTVVESAPTVFTSEGHQIQLRNTSSGTAAATANVTLTCGGLVVEWDLVTEGTPPPPAANPWDPVEYPTSNVITIAATTNNRTFDGDAASGADMKVPGTTIVLEGGTHGSRTFQNLHGTAEEPIYIINQPAELGGSAKVTIQEPTVTNGSRCMLIRDCTYIVVDGQQRWTGAPAFTDGNDPLTFPTETKGICLVNKTNGDSLSNMLAVQGCSTNIKIRGIEGQGNWDFIQDSGQGAGAGIKLVSGTDTMTSCRAASSDPNYRGMEDIIIEYTYFHDLEGEAYYLGNNMTDGSSLALNPQTDATLPPPLVGLILRYNYGRNMGLDSINLKKSAWEKSTQIYGNIFDTPDMRIYGTLSSPEDGMQLAQMTGTGGLDFYQNLFKNGMHTGLNINCKPDAPRSIYGEDHCPLRIHDNVIIRPGELSDTSAVDGFGIKIARNDAANAYDADIYNNTIVGSWGAAVKITDPDSVSRVGNNVWANCSTNPDDADFVEFASGADCVEHNNVVIAAAAFGTNFVDAGTTAIGNGTYSQTGTRVTVSLTAHGLSAGDHCLVTPTSGNGLAKNVVVLSANLTANQFQYVAYDTQSTSGNCSVATQNDDYRLLNTASTIIDQAVTTDGSNTFLVSTEDFDGVARPLGDEDCGAFEYVA